MLLKKVFSRQSLLASISLLIWLFCIQLATAQTIKLTWDPPTTNEDGSILRDLRDYKLSYGQSSGSSTTVISRIPSNSYELVNLPTGIYYARVTAFNQLGIESRASNELLFAVGNVTLPTQTPSPTATQTRTPTPVATQIQITPTAIPTNTIIPTIPALPTSIATPAIPSPTATSSPSFENRKTTIIGSIKDSSGKALSKVRIYASGDSSLSGTSDKFGEFKITGAILGKPYRLKAQRSDYLITPEFIDIIAGVDLDIKFTAYPNTTPNSCTSADRSQSLADLDLLNSRLNNIAIEIIEELKKFKDDKQYKKAYKLFLYINSEYENLLGLSQSIPEIFLSCPKTAACSNINLHSSYSIYKKKISRLNSKLEMLIELYKEFNPKKKKSTHSFVKIAGIAHKKSLSILRSLPDSHYKCS